MILVKGNWSSGLLNDIQKVFVRVISLVVNCFVGLGKWSYQSSVLWRRIFVSEEI